MDFTTSYTIRIPDLIDEEFVVNQYAMQFRSFAITIDRDLSTEEVQLKISPVVSVVHDYDRIRVILNIKRSVKTAQAIKDLFLTGFNQYPNIVVMVKMIDDGPEGQCAGYR